MIAIVSHRSWTREPPPATAGAYRFHETFSARPHSGPWGSTARKTPDSRGSAPPSPGTNGRTHRKHSARKC